MDAATVAIAGYMVLMTVAVVASVTRDGWVLPIAGATVAYLWIFGEIAVQFDWFLPTALYLVMDVGACVGFWFWGRSLGARLFATTFAAQVGLSVAYMADLIAASPIEFWWIHAATGYAQLLVLLGWAWVEHGKKVVEA